MPACQPALLSPHNDGCITNFITLMETGNEKRANEITRKELRVYATRVGRGEGVQAAGVCECACVYCACMRNEPLRVVNCLNCVILDEQSDMAMT